MSLVLRTDSSGRREIETEHSFSDDEIERGNVLDEIQRRDEAKVNSICENVLWRPVDRTSIRYPEARNTVITTTYREMIEEPLFISPEAKADATIETPMRPIVGYIEANCGCRGDEHAVKFYACRDHMKTPCANMSCRCHERDAKGRPALVHVAFEREKELRFDCKASDASPPEGPPMTVTIPENDRIGRRSWPWALPSNASNALPIPAANPVTSGNDASNGIPDGTPSFDPAFLNHRWHAESFQYIGEATRRAILSQRRREPKVDEGQHTTISVELEKVERLKNSERAKLIVGEARSFLMRRHKGWPACGECHEPMKIQGVEVQHENPVEGLIRLWCEKDNPDLVIGVRFPLSERARR